MKLSRLVFSFVVLASASLAVATEEGGCPEGKEAACAMAHYQAEGYNTGVIKREGQLGFDRALAEGEVVVIRIGVDFERQGSSVESSSRETQMVSMFSKPAKALCGSAAYDMLINAGGRYETQIFDKHQIKWMTIPLDCQASGKTVAELN